MKQRARNRKGIRDPFSARVPLAPFLVCHNDTSTVKEKLRSLSAAVKQKMLSLLHAAARLSTGPCASASRLTAALTARPQPLVDARNPPLQV